MDICFSAIGEAKISMKGFIEEEMAEVTKEFIGTVGTTAGTTSSILTILRSDWMNTSRDYSTIWWLSWPTYRRGRDSTCHLL